MTGQVSVSASVRHFASQESLSEPLRPAPSSRGGQDQCSEAAEEVSRADHQDRVPDHRGGQQRRHHRHLDHGELGLQHLPVRCLHLTRSLSSVLARARASDPALSQSPGPLSQPLHAPGLAPGPQQPHEVSQPRSGLGSQDSPALSR